MAAVKRLVRSHSDRALVRAAASDPVTPTALLGCALLVSLATHHTAAAWFCLAALGGYSLSGST